MNIKQLYEDGEITIEETQNALYNIGFVNSDGEDDETQFTVNAESEKAAVEELIQLFRDFCVESGFNDSDVLYVEYVSQDIEI